MGKVTYFFSVHTKMVSYGISEFGIWRVWRFVTTARATHHSPTIYLPHYTYCSTRRGWRREQGLGDEQVTMTLTVTLVGPTPAQPQPRPRFNPDPILNQPQPNPNPDPNPDPPFQASSLVRSGTPLFPRSVPISTRPPLSRSSPLGHSGSSTARCVDPQAARP